MILEDSETKYENTSAVFLENVTVNKWHVIFAFQSEDNHQLQKLSPSFE